MEVTARQQVAVSAPEALEILLLCDYRPEGAATIIDHIQTLCDDTGHRVRRLSLLGDLPANLDLDRFDAVLVHYSLILSNDNYVSPASRDRLRDYDGLKIVFIQDEYRWVNRATEALAYIGADLLFTCVPDGDVDEVYSPAIAPKLRKVTTLTGFVPEELLGVEPLPFDERRIDVGYRARKLSALFGKLAREKHLIAERFLRDAPRYGLVTDISCAETDRLYGDRWIEFIRNCRAVLGSESGASVFDFDGSLQPAIELYEREHPEASFEEIESKFFAGQDGRISMNQISPRCFEAAALRTLMVLYEGNYSGVLIPWRHYVPLRKDHSNMDEVVSVLRDPARWGEIIESAYQEVACNPRWSYRYFGQQVGHEIRELWRGKTRPAVTPYGDAEYLLATTAHQIALTTRRSVRESFYSFVERLPGPVFRGLRRIRRSVLPRR